MSLITTMFESTATGKRASIGRDSAQGTTQEFDQTLFTCQPCSYQENGASIIDVYGQRQTAVHPQVFFASDPNIEANDLLIVYSPRTGKTVYLIVLGEAEPVARGRFFTVDVERKRYPV